MDNRDLERMGEIAETLLQSTPHQVPRLQAQIATIANLELPVEDEFRAHLYLALVACKAQHRELPDVEFWNLAVKQFQIAAAWMAQDLRDPITVH